MDEYSTRHTGSTAHAETLFAAETRDGVTFVTVPKNIEVFENNLLMKSILKIYERKSWIPVLSSKELPSAVLETKDGAFFAGFVYASLQSETGPLNTDTSKWAKGVKAFQTYSVEKVYGKPVHLRTGGMSKLTAKLSEMKGFTRDHWSLRATIAGLFRSIPGARVTELHTYMAPKSEIIKGIKTKFVYQNGGIFRPEEIQYLDSRYNDAKELLSGFLSELDAPSPRFVEEFGARYSRVKQAVDRADSEIRPTAVERSKIAFPTDKSRRAAAFAKKPLGEKLMDIREERLVHFLPESLPGIMRTGDRSTHRVGTVEWKADHYGHSAGNDAAESVIDSWYASYDASLREDA